MIGDAPARNDLRDVVKVHKGMQKLRFTTYDVKRDEPVELAGAEGRTRVDAQYTMVSQAAKVLVREVNLLVQTEDGRQLDFFVRSPAGDYAGGEASGDLRLLPAAMTRAFWLGLVAAAGTFFVLAFVAAVITDSATDTLEQTNTVCA